MPWPSEKLSTSLRKKVGRLRKWLISYPVCSEAPRRSGLAVAGACPRWRERVRTALDLVEGAAAARVDGPGDEDAGHVEGQEHPECRFGAARQRDERAVHLR